MSIKSMSNAEIIQYCIRLDREQKNNRQELNAYKTEIQARALAQMDDKNVKYIKFYGSAGSAAVTDSMSLDILNPDKLKQYIGTGVYDMKIKENVKTEYKCDRKFEKALKAIFTGDYTFECTLDEFLSEMSVRPDAKQTKLLQKRLKGEYEPDKQTLEAVFGTGVDFDVELWFIYKIKNGELIKSFLPEEGLDLTIAGIKQSIFVESKTAITLDYQEENEEDSYHEATN